MAFTRRAENFTCKHCGLAVPGDGYTNHCPRRLWSQHVDITPGDRAEQCRGLMEPISSRPTRHHFKIYWRCQKCGLVKSNKSATSDNQEILISLSTKPSF